MKQFVVFVALVAFAAAAKIVPLTPERESLFAKCQEETNTSDAVAHLIKAHKIDFDDEDGKCMIKCVCLASTFCDKNLKVNTALWQKETSYTPEEFTAAGTKCNQIEGAHDCDTAYLRFQCVVKELPEIPTHA